MGRHAPGREKEIEVTYYYLAGPMRGYDEFNFPAFRRIAERLRVRGYTIASPAEKDSDDGYDWTGTKGTDEELAAADFDISQVLKADIGIIAAPDCVGVIAMSGWENSAGARAEVAFAQATGRVTYRVFEQVSRDNTKEPWQDSYEDAELHLVAMSHRTVGINYGEVHDKWLP